MIEGESKLDSKYAFFRVCLYVAVFATFFQLAISVIETPSAFHLILSSGLFLVSLSSLVFWKVSSRYIIIILVNAAVWTLAFTLYWIETNGVYSAPAYVFFVLIIVFIITLPKPYGYYYTILMSVICIVLTLLVPTGEGQQGFQISEDLYYVLTIQFLISLLVIVISLYFLKTNFDKEREKNQESNETLIQLTAELEKKKKELLVKRQKIEDLKKNLEHLVHERTLQLEEKNEQLSQYAYDNAHILRGALCNILAIISLIKKEQNDTQTMQKVDKLNQKAVDLDNLVYQVNNLLK